MARKTRDRRSKQTVQVTDKRELARTGPAGQEQTEDGPPAWQVWLVELARLARRHRRQLLPLALIGLLAVLGRWATSRPEPVLLTIRTASAVLLIAGLLAMARHRARSRAGVANATLAMFGSTSWLLLAGLSGHATGTVAATLLIGGAVLSIPWWVRHSQPDPDVSTEAGQPAPPAMDRRTHLWGTHIAARGCPLPDSQLDEITEIRYGWRTQVQLPVGGHWHSVADAATRRVITSVYSLPDARVVIEPVPGESVRRCWMTVLTHDPLQTTRTWTAPGLDPATGTFPIMTTADGETLSWRLWLPGGGAHMGLVSGTTGAGKTKTLDLLLAEAASSDRILPWVIDGGGGASMPHWIARAPLAAINPEDARALLRHALAVMDARRATLRRQGGGSLEPSPNQPLILIVLDEAHKLLMNDPDTGEDNSDVKRMCEKLAQEGRKFGISLVLGTQVPSAAQLGGSTVLRDQLKSGTVIGLRVQESSSQNMITSGQGLPERLSHLPATFPDGTATNGLGYMLTGRHIRARSLLITDDTVAATGMRHTSLDAATASVTPPQLSGLTDLDDEDLDDEAPDETGPQPDATQDAEEPPAEHAGGGPAGAPPAVTTIAEARNQQSVADAIRRGCPTDVATLMRVTGLPMGPVKRGLNRHHASEETQ